MPTGPDPEITTPGSNAAAPAARPGRCFMADLVDIRREPVTCRVEEACPIPMAG